MMLRNLGMLSLLLIFCLQLVGQDITIDVKAKEGQQVVSPYIYGKNNCFSNVFGSATSASEIQLYKEAGLRFARENTGNNATKYNWRKKISSHPDWYNNVYDHDWDFAAKTIQSNMPNIKSMWGFQLIGKVAANKNNNFNDWSYNQSQWWSGCSQNLAGGGQLNSSGGSDALVDGDPDLYLMDWNADSTTGILDHWFSDKGLGLNKENFAYWNMDNEPEIWSGTHDDVMPKQIEASKFMDSYFEVAKKARAQFPDIKLVGPVPANEWQWYKWGNESLKINGTYYCWLEYFIKRVADEQKATGIRLLDVLDIHWYPDESSNTDIVQLHRIFYDMNYTYPGANGVKTVGGGWSDSQKKEYIFKRINDWLDKYMGPGHGVTLGVTESGINSSDANINASLYASILGTFANNGVEIYTPWTWKTGMWEVLHLFSRYAKDIKVNTTSSLETNVSGYSTMSADADSLTVIMVNRNLTSSKSVLVTISDFAAENGSYESLELSALPSGETFKSHTSNALKSKSVSVENNSFTVTLPALSITAVLLKGKGTIVNKISLGSNSNQTLKVFPNPSEGAVTISFPQDKPLKSIIRIIDQCGRQVDMFEWDNSGGTPLILDTTPYRNGVYAIRVTNDKFSGQCKLVVANR